MKQLALVALFLAGCYDPTGEETTIESQPLLTKRLLPQVEDALSKHRGVRVHSTSGGVAGFVSGFERSLDLDEVGPLFALDRDELELVESSGDLLGGTAVRYRQLERGLPVENGVVVLHYDARGDLFAIHGSARGDSAPSEAALAEDEARAQLSSSASEGRLTYVITSGERRLHLAYAFEVTGEEDGTPIDGTWYVDAIDGRIIERAPRVHSALSRRLFDARNTEQLPGVPARAEGEAASSDAIVNQAYDHAGAAHGCMELLFGRDAIDGAGGDIVSTVHFGTRYNNAFWNGTQITFGDGDGSTFSNLAGSFDITVHEMVHGVTQHTAGLVYQNEPGALNEAFSDVIAAACESWRSQDSTGIWRIGEEVFTPSISDDALRYLNDPVRDGISRDFYPERYQESEDNGGVHLNSGIPNLAFSLLAQGGVHPRGRSTVEVQALGIVPAAQIYHRALTRYLTPISTMEDARAATAQAALDLFGSSAAEAVHQSWNAVGVLAGQGPHRHDPVPLLSGAPLGGLMGDAGEERIFRIEVPADTLSFQLQMSGGSGDADLYLRFGEPPTLIAFDHRPYLPGNVEALELSDPTAGTWYAMVQGFGSYAGVTLAAQLVGRPIPPPVELCDQPGDEDGNGLTDCADPVCNLACDQMVVAGDLVISELMPLPAGTGAEWIEIHNTSTRTIDLAGFTVRFHAASQREHRIVRPLPLDGGGYTVLSLAAGFGDYQVPAGTSTLFDHADQIAILDRSRIELDRVSYPHAPLAVWSGISFEASRLDPTQNDDGSAWCYSDAPSYDAEDNRGTPGQASICRIARARAPHLGELVITELAPAQGWFEVISLADGPVDLYGTSIDVDGVSQSIDRSIVLAPGERTVLDGAGATIAISDAAGALHDRVRSNGDAIELDAFSLDAALNDSGGAWCSSAGTPGTAGTCAPAFTRLYAGGVGETSGELSAVLRNGAHHITLVAPRARAFDYYRSVGGAAFNRYTGGTTDSRHANIAVDAMGRLHRVAFTRAPYAGGYPPDRFIYTGAYPVARFDIGAGSLGQAAIAVDSQNRVHIVYGTRNNLIHLRYVAERWYATTISTTGQGGFLSALAVDASDALHLVYHDPSTRQLSYGRWNGTWAVQGLGLIDQPTTPAAIAVAADGTAHVAYDRRISAERELWYASIGAAVRQSRIDRRLVMGDGIRAGIAVDERGRPYVAYHSTVLGSLRLAALFGSLWSGVDLPSSQMLGAEIVVQIEDGVAAIAAADKSLWSTSAYAWRGTVAPPPLFLMGDRGENCNTACAREGRACAGPASVGLECGAFTEVDYCSESASWIYAPQYGGFCTDSWGAAEACAVNFNVLHQFCCRCE